jgi:hypothetical protein
LATSGRDRLLEPAALQKNPASTGCERPAAMSIARDSTYYRRWAEQLRSAAAAPLSMDDRDTLYSFADEFDALADQADLAEGMQYPDK